MIRPIAMLSLAVTLVGCSGASSSSDKGQSSAVTDSVDVGDSPFPDPSTPPSPLTHFSGKISTQTYPPVDQDKSNAATDGEPLPGATIRFVGASADGAEVEFASALSDASGNFGFDVVCVSAFYIRITRADGGAVISMPYINASGTNNRGAPNCGFAPEGPFDIHVGPDQNGTMSFANSGDW